MKQIWQTFLLSLIVFVFTMLVLFGINAAVLIIKLMLKHKVVTTVTWQGCIVLWVVCFAVCAGFKYIRSFN